MSIEVKSFWEQFDAFPGPSADEIRLDDGTTGSPLLADGRPTARYAEVQKLYRMLFSGLLIAKSRLDHLDDRLLNEGFRWQNDDEENDHQRYDLLGLHYFYIRSDIHVERLTAEDVSVFETCLTERTEDALQAALSRTEATYREILPRAPGHPERLYELYPTIHGEGLVSGDALALMLHTAADYDASGMLADKDADRRRIRVSYLVQEQLEPILSRALGMKVAVLVEV